MFWSRLSHVCTRDLNQGKELNNHLVKLHRGREELPRSKDKGVQKQSERNTGEDCGVGAWNTNTPHIVNLYSLKPLQQSHASLSMWKNNTTENLHEIISEPYNLPYIELL